MLLDGYKTAEELRKSIAEEIKTKNLDITLVVFIVGENPASQIYVRNKAKACEEVGIKSVIYAFEENTSQKEIIDKIEECNKDKSINGILVQLPLPSHLNEKEIIDKIDPNKDVDGLTTINQGKMFKGEESILPATPKGIITLLKNNNIEIKGKNAVVLGRSILVGKPVAMLLLQENATVTICHTKTVNLKEITRKADILVVAIKNPRFITEEYVKHDAVVVDVGINRVMGKVCGDVDFDSVFKVASYVSPVPRGVGPMTIASLLENVLCCYKLQKR